MDMPITWLEQSIESYFNRQPFEVKGTANDEVAFNKRYLYTKLYSVFEFGLPKAWSQNWFRLWLFHYGSIGVLYTKELGWICNPYSIKKLNWCYQPAVIEVSNHALKSTKTGVIGVNAGIIHLMDDFFGLDDLVTRYAERLSQIDRSVNVNLMNVNVSAFFTAEDKKQAELIKEAYGRATEGHPFVVVNKDAIGDGRIEPLINNVDFLVDKLLQARRTIVNEFLTEIGIKNANYDKKERLNSQEVNQNNDETRAIISVIYDNLKKDFNDINTISDLDLTVSLRYDYTEGGDTDGENNSLRMA